MTWQKNIISRSLLDFFCSFQPHLMALINLEIKQTLLTDERYEMCLEVPDENRSDVSSQPHLYTLLCYNHFHTMSCKVLNWEKSGLIICNQILGGKNVSLVLILFFVHICILIKYFWRFLLLQDSTFLFKYAFNVHLKWKNKQQNKSLHCISAQSKLGVSRYMSTDNNRDI